MLDYVPTANTEHWGLLSSRNVLSRPLITENRALIRNARTAARVCTLYEEAASQDTSPTGTDPDKLTAREEILAAYYGIWFTSIFAWDVESMIDRLEAVGKREIDGMAAMTRYLVFDCPDDERFRIGIAHQDSRIVRVWRLAFGAITWISGDGATAMKVHRDMIGSGTVVSVV